MSLYPSLNVVNIRPYSKRQTVKELHEELCLLEENLAHKRHKLLQTRVSIIKQDVTDLGTTSDEEHVEEEEEEPNDNTRNDNVQSSPSNTMYIMNLRSTDDLNNLYDNEADLARYQPTFSDSDEGVDL
ncbi:hypothetical protein G6F56_010628 [Rhizopus delemar]|nr:hypothetical protein G6F56_010628 [Rhizopus delemar]